MPDLTTTIVLIVLTLLALGATAMAWSRVWWPGAHWTPRSAVPQRVLLAVCGVGSLVLFAYRALVVHESWDPLQAHVDGLVLIAALVAGTVLFLQTPSRVPGVAPFALPVVTVVLAWAICASRFTLELYAIATIWNTIHLAAVYGGTVFLAIAAVAGGMFLHAQRRLQQKLAADDEPAGPVASLEAIETLIVRTSTLGFAILSLGLVTGVILIASLPASRLGEGWWYSPKVLLAFSVWLIYGLIVNVRHTTHFRGRRAAWLSIAGLVLLLATFGVVTAMGGQVATAEPEPGEPTPHPTSKAESPEMFGLENRTPASKGMPRAVISPQFQPSTALYRTFDLQLSPHRSWTPCRS